jgi:formylglycine-generating enzyme required for sulfatase activity
MAFMNDGGYDNSLLWLSDGWATAQAELWKARLYWEQRDGTWWTMTLRGFQPVNEDASVSHICYFEAYAFARWSGHRLPTEFEWEAVAAKSLMDGNFPIAAFPALSQQRLQRTTWRNCSAIFGN